MNEEMEALISQGTWELVSAPTDAVVVGCRWVYTLKNRPDGSVDRYNARLVAKGYIQTCGVTLRPFPSCLAELHSNFVFYCG